MPRVQKVKIPRSTGMIVYYEQTMWALKKARHNYNRQRSRECNDVSTRVGSGFWAQVMNDYRRILDKIDRGEWEYAPSRKIKWV